jgi:hypothetical protein
MQSPIYLPDGKRQGDPDLRPTGPGERREMGRHPVSLRSPGRPAGAGISGGSFQGAACVILLHEERNGDYQVSIRFSTGSYTYRVFSGSKSGAGVEVDDAKGKAASTIHCAERPAMWAEYLRLNLPRDPQNPHGAAACKEEPYAGK